MIKDIRHTGIVVEDLERSMCFYVNLLGFKIAKKMEESSSYIDKILELTDARVTTVKLIISDNQMVELLQFHTHKGKHFDKSLIDTGPTHIAMTVDDLEFEYNKLKNEGVPFISPPQLSPDGYAKVAFCRAPEGTFIELVEVRENA